MTVKKSLPSKAPMPSSGHIPSCPLDQQRTSNVYQIHSRCWQPMKSACPAIRSCHRWWYKHKNHCWQHFQLVRFAWKGTVVHGMSASHLPGLPTLIELAQKLHLFQEVQVCWYWCLSRRKLPCHVKASTSWRLASTHVHPGHCKDCWVCTVLRQVHPSMWASNCPTLQPNNQTWIYQAGCATLDNRRSRFLWQHKTGNIIRSMPEAFWPQPSHCSTVRFLVKGVWKCCLPTENWHCFDRSNGRVLLWFGLQFYD